MSHQDRREPLPEDYQFGDAVSLQPAIVVTDEGFTANVIEGEPFHVDRDLGDETT